MTKGEFISDQDFLTALMVESIAPHLRDKDMRDILERIVREAIEKQIAEGIIEPKDKDQYLEIQLASIDPVRTFQNDALNRIRAQALNFLGSERSLLERVPVGALSTLELNAFAIRTPRGGAAVSLNGNLWAFLKAIDYCAFATIFRGSPAAIGSHHSDEVYVQNLLLVIQTIRMEGIFVAPTEGKYSISDCIGPAARSDGIIALLMTTQLTFILLHEYGHIYHGHLDANLIRRVLTGAADLDVYLTSHQQEFEADEFAVRRLLCSSQDEGERQFYVMAVAMLFHLFDACEEKNGNDERLLGTHPASVDRLEKICTICAELCGSEAWSKTQHLLVPLNNLFAVLKNSKLDPEAGTVLYIT
jgi:hypothetical protein